MGIKKHQWIDYGRQGDIVEIVIRDNTGAKIDSFRCKGSDKKARAIIGNLLSEKYNIDFKPEIDVEQSINTSKKDQADWLKKDMAW